MKAIPGEGRASPKALGWVQVYLVSDTECSFVWLMYRKWGWGKGVKVRTRTERQARCTQVKPYEQGKEFGLYFECDRKLQD